MSKDDIMPGPAITITVEGEPVTARAGQTIAAALYAHGRRVFRHTRVGGKPRGLYCAMGVCFDCIVKVEGRTVRACMTEVAEGMRVTLPTRFEKAADIQ